MEKKNPVHSYSLLRTAKARNLGFQITQLAFQPKDLLTASSVKGSIRRAGALGLSCHGLEWWCQTIPQARSHFCGVLELRLQILDSVGNFLRRRVAQLDDLVDLCQNRLGDAHVHHMEDVLGHNVAVQVDGRAENLEVLFGSDWKR